MCSCFTIAQSEHAAEHLISMSLALNPSNVLLRMRQLSLRSSFSMTLCERGNLSTRNSFEPGFEFSTSKRVKSANVWKEEMEQANSRR